MTVPHPAQAPLPEAAWGPLLASYVVLVGLPSGVTLTTWWLGRQRLSEAATIDRYGAWGAMGALALISVLLVFDLGRPERFYLMITRFDNLGSPIAVGAKLIAAKMFLLAVLIYGFERGRRSANAAEPMVAGRKTGSVLAWIVVFISFALAVYPASLLSRSWASPLAGSSGSALIFLITALLMGTAAVLLTVSVLGAGPGTRELLRAGRRALLLLLGCFAVTLLFEMLSLAGRAPDRLLAGEVLTGGSAAMFWGVVVAGGIAVPAVGLLFFRTHREAVFVSAAAVLAGAAATRYLLFAVGQ